MIAAHFHGDILRLTPEGLPGRAALCWLSPRSERRDFRADSGSWYIRVHPRSEKSQNQPHDIRLQALPSLILDVDSRELNAGLRDTTEAACTHA